MRYFACRGGTRFRIRFNTALEKGVFREARGACPEWPYILIAGKHYIGALCVISTFNDYEDNTSKTMMTENGHAVIFDLAPKVGGIQSQILRTPLALDL